MNRSICWIKGNLLLNIPAKILVEDCVIISPVIIEIFNESKSIADFPNPLKLADITPAHKKEERTIDLSVSKRERGENYRPVSIKKRKRREL